MKKYWLILEQNKTLDVTAPVTFNGQQQQQRGDTNVEL